MRAAAHHTPRLAWPILLLLGAGCQGEPEAAGQIGLSVKVAPIPVTSDKGINLGYEVTFTPDYADLGYTLTKLEVLRGESGDEVVKAYDAQRLKGDEKEGDVLRLPADPLPTEEELKLTGKVRSPTAIVWLQLDKSATVPSALHHRAHFVAKDAASGATPLVVEGGVTAVRHVAPVVISPPLSGDNWLALETIADDVHHTRGLITVDGQTRVPQRYAVDWMRLSTDGKLWSNDGKKNEDYAGYQAELLAVADGTVVETMDGIQEGVGWVEKPQVPVDKLCGNYVLLDIGNDRYALYAHAIPGSIKVKVGDKVKAGDVLALMGNSGNSNATHLHFHICDAKSALGCEGLPYVIDAFKVQGDADLYDLFDFDNNGGAWTASGAPRDVADVIPDTAAVITFP